MRAILLVALVLTWNPPPAAGQKSIQVGPDPACRNCTITLRQVAQLGRDDDSVLIEQGARILVDSRGRYIVTYTHDRERFAVFEKTGRLIGGVGQYGRGPGEWTWLGGMVVGPGDSIHMFSRQHFVIDPALNVIQSRPLDLGNAFVESALMFPDGAVVMLANIPTRRSIGHPLHLLGAQGAVARSFGSDSAPYTPDRSSMLSRKITHADSGRFWAAWYNRYQIDLWDTSGVLHKTLRRNAPWFVPWIHPAAQIPFEVPPNGRIMDVQQDERGRLWVLISVASSRWKPSQSPAREYRIGPSEWSRHNDSILEVIDPQNGRLLHSQRFDRMYSGFAQKGHLYSKEEDHTGIVVVKIWKMELVTPK